MNAIELAECFELSAVDHGPEGWPAKQQDALNKAAAMLRKQHDAINTLRDALANHFYSPCYAASQAAKKALKDTESL